MATGVEGTETAAWDRSEPGGPLVYRGPTKDVINGWRVQTPPIVEFPEETLEEIYAKQVGRRE